tara:strand:- start:379 stop:660 length:282 start_codon:yes stop_codon:yes gene_type:complete
MSNKFKRVNFRIRILIITAFCFGLIFWTRIILIVNPSETAIAFKGPSSDQIEERKLKFSQSGFYRPSYTVIGHKELLFKGNWPWMSKLRGVLM